MSESVRAVERALDILSCFNRNESVLSLTRIAERVSMPKSTVHRLLATLEHKRFIHRNETTGMYQLGFRSSRWPRWCNGTWIIQQWAQPYLQRLCAECGRDGGPGGSGWIIRRLSSGRRNPQHVKLAVAVGQRLPAFCTASGKAFLAYLPDDEVDKILARA